jgi:iron complex transport system permease protein
VKKDGVKNSLVMIILSLLVLGIALFSLTVGSSGMTILQSIQALFSHSGSIDRTIVLEVRLPRTLLGLAVGGALSLAGVILQGLFRNPLVEPYTLGISGGAVLGVALCISFNVISVLGIFSLPVSGFLGALLVILVLYVFAVRNSQLHVQNVLLMGVMFSFISSSLMMLIMAVSKTESLERIIFWMMGSLEQNNWGLIRLALVLSGASLVVSYFFAIDLNALSLGEEQAVHLGINIERSKRFLFIIASVITGFSVSVAGVISFVGLLIPHFMRMLVGRDHRVLLAASFLGGSGFLVLSDVIAKTIIAPRELPVGVITGLLGGILFIYTLSTRKVRL